MATHRSWLAFNHALAVTIGLLLALGEAVRSWGAGRHWASWLDDQILGAFLLYGAWHSATGRGRLPLAAAWGFSCGLLYPSFFHHWQTAAQPDPGNLPHHCVLLAVALCFAGSILGLLLTLLEGRTPGGAQPL
jgi:hypothetical protein